MMAMTGYSLLDIHWLFVRLWLCLFVVDGMNVTFMFNKLQN